MSMIKKEDVKAAIETAYFENEINAYDPRTKVALVDMKSKIYKYLEL